MGGGESLGPAPLPFVALARAQDPYARAGDERLPDTPEDRERRIAEYQIRVRKLTRRKRKPGRGDTIFDRK